MHTGGLGSPILGRLPEGSWQVPHPQRNLKWALAPLEGDVEERLELAVGILSDVNRNLLVVRLRLVLRRGRHFEIEILDSGYTELLTLHALLRH